MKYLLLLSFTLMLQLQLLSQNIILNPSFEQGSIPDNQGQLNRADNWTSFQTDAYNPCLFQPYFADLFDKRSPNCFYDIPVNKWSGGANLRQGGTGNRYVGASPTESIVGKLSQSTQANTLYEISFWARAINGNNINPCIYTAVGNVVNKSGIKVTLLNAQCPTSEVVIYNEQEIVPQSWKKYTKVFNMPTTAANFTHIRFEVIRLGPLGTSASSYLDEVELRKWQPTCNEIEEFGHFELIQYQSNQNTINKMKFSISNLPPPQFDLGSWWNIYEANNCDMNDLSGYIEPPLRNVHYGNDFTVITPDSGHPSLNVDKCYIIKHGVYTDNCTWTEERLKVKLVTNITN